MFINMAIATVLSLLLGFGALYGIALIQDDFASPAELTEELACRCWARSLQSR